MVLHTRPFSKQMLPDMPHTHTNVATWGTIWEPSTALWTLQCQMEPNVVNLYPAINKSSPFGTPQLPNWPHRSTHIWWNLPFGTTYNAKYTHKLINWVPLVPTSWQVPSCQVVYVSNRSTHIPFGTMELATGGRYPCVIRYLCNSGVGKECGYTYGHLCPACRVPHPASTRSGIDGVYIHPQAYKFSSDSRQMHLTTAQMEPNGMVIRHPINAKWGSNQPTHNQQINP